MNLFSEKELNIEWFQKLKNELENGIQKDSFIRFYQCFCADSLCNSTWGKVYKTKDTFKWFFMNKKDKILEFNFEKDAYTKVFKDYLKQSNNMKDDFFLFRG